MKCAGNRLPDAAVKTSMQAPTHPPSDPPTHTSPHLPGAHAPTLERLGGQFGGEGEARRVGGGGVTRA